MKCRTRKPNPTIPTPIFSCCPSICPALTGSKILTKNSAKAKELGEKSTAC